MRCEVCGTQCSEGAKFCAHCGASLTTSGYPRLALPSENVPIVRESIDNGPHIARASRNGRMILSCERNAGDASQAKGGETITTASTQADSESVSADPKAASRKSRSPRGVFGSIVSGVLCGALALAILAFVLLLFLNGVAQFALMPSLGGLSGEQLTAFSASWVSVFIGIALVAIPTLLIVAANADRASRGLLFIGCAIAIAGTLIGLFGLIRQPTARLLPDEWRGFFFGSIDALGDYAFLWATVLVAAAAVCLSVYACTLVANKAREVRP